jgi:hypothetical protein
VGAAVGAVAAPVAAPVAELTAEPAVFVTFFAAPVRELNSPARPEAGAFEGAGAGAAAEELELIYLRPGFRRRLTCDSYDCGELNDSYGCGELNDSYDFQSHQIMKACRLEGLKFYNY